MSYLTHAINDSATLCGEAAGAIAPLTAVKFDGNGKLATSHKGRFKQAVTSAFCRSGTARSLTRPLQMRTPTSRRRSEYRG